MIWFENIKANQFVQNIIGQIFILIEKEKRIYETFRVGYIIKYKNKFKFK